MSKSKKPTKKLKELMTPAGEVMQPVSLSEKKRLLAQGCFDANRRSGD